MVAMFPVLAAAGMAARSAIRRPISGGSGGRVANARFHQGGGYAAGLQACPAIAHVASVCEHHAYSGSVRQLVKDRRCPTHALGESANLATAASGQRPPGRAASASKRRAQMLRGVGVCSSAFKRLTRGRIGAVGQLAQMGY